MTAPLLQVRNLQVCFQPSGSTTRPAIDGISFNLARNRVTAIVGESGSGKSLTALAIQQLLPTSASLKGSMRFWPAREEHATELVGLPETDMQQIRGRRISMIFQEPMTSLNPLMTCGEQVSEMLRHHLRMSTKKALSAALDLFEQVRLPAPATLARKYPHQLSGGQKQRVMIAISIACQPDLLIADEPTTALDVVVQKAILKLLRDLQQASGMGLLFITHDLALVEDLADDVMVLYQGQILEQGPAAEVLRNPTHPYTQALLACRPVRHLPGTRLPVVSDYLGTDPVHAIMPKAAQANGAPINSSQQPKDVLVEVKDLVVSHESRHTRHRARTLNGVSLEIFKGEMLGLVGPSGCGKTTLGRALLRLLPIEAGSIRLGGRDLTGIPSRELRALRQDVQIVFQDPYGSLNPRLTIGSMLTEPLKVHRRLSEESQRRDQAGKLLQRVGLGIEHLDRYPHEFSGGQRQRIGIARALALEPAFIVFDESVSALDVSVQAQVLNLLAELRKELGFTALFISHDLAVVRHMCERVLVMHQGEIAESGLVSDVFQRPVHPCTRQLLDALPESLGNFGYPRK
ncbi:MAG: ABC transporter ATP-binding protein [Bacteroidetes bacterium]|nr:ABC transporter ATP-binding protein [Bacteroidota bacterium]